MFSLFDVTIFGKIKQNIQGTTSSEQFEIVASLG